MQIKLAVIALFAVTGGLLYLLAMRSTPGHGWLECCEKLFIGLAAVYLINRLLAPFSLQIAQNPISSLAAGYLGLPGVALTFVIQKLL
ncbi:MAG: pro-sigmaK processing inhibitor BofA family protein [Eubacteriales bacterium]|nr:pro-sigmaK processing inhibitor BofA family protein [Eubacteriales bacterium]